MPRSRGNHRRRSAEAEQAAGGARGAATTTADVAAGGGATVTPGLAGPFTTDPSAVATHDHAVGQHLPGDRAGSHVNEVPSAAATVSGSS